jgi:uncharacterized membrane protein YcaP (DUF421 family)
METLFAVDWQSMFVPSLALAEIVLRGSLMYLALFAILRFMSRRQSGHLSPSDLLVIVLIADAAQNALGKDYNSLTEGVVLVLTIIAWDHLIDWLAWRFPSLEHVLRPSALKLVENGKILEQNLRKDMITHDELMSQLRQKGLEDTSRIKVARLEGDGQLSVIKREG